MEDVKGLLLEDKVLPLPEKADTSLVNPFDKMSSGIDKVDISRPQHLVRV